MAGQDTPPLRLHRRLESNVTSQAGEDGIIRAIFEQLEIRDGTAVEFGAWDGEHLSNTAQLRGLGWRVCLIEGDEARFARLRDRFSGAANVICVHAWVTPSGPSSLDNLLAKEGLLEIDFLSIDIDGDDYHIWHQMGLRPKVVCIEFNPSIPPPISFVGKIGASQGSSLTAFAELAHRKGYSLAGATRLNAFFIRDDVADRFVQISAGEAYVAENARILISEYNGRNRLVDFNGLDRPALNPWTKEPSALVLKFRVRPRGVRPRAKKILLRWLWSALRSLHASHLQSDE